MGPFHRCFAHPPRYRYLRASRSRSPRMKEFQPMEYTELIQKASKRDRERNGRELIQCEHCGSTNTPLWRSGPSGPKSLCNACGLRWAKGTLRIISRSGVVVAPPKGRDPTAHTKTVC